MVLCQASQGDLVSGKGRARATAFPQVWLPPWGMQNLRVKSESPNSDLREQSIHSSLLGIILVEAMSANACHVYLMVYCYYCHNPYLNI